MNYNQGVLPQMLDKHAKRLKDFFSHVPETLDHLKKCQREEDFNCLTACIGSFNTSRMLPRRMNENNHILGQLSYRCHGNCY